MKYYIVLERNYEYNDESYYFPAKTGGLPTDVFLIEKEAKEKCFRLNYERVKGLSIGEFYDEFDIQDLKEDCPDLIIGDSWNAKIKDDFTMEQYKEIAGYLSPFYFVYTLESK